MFTSNVSGQLQLASALDLKQNAYTAREGFLGVMREQGSSGAAAFLGLRMKIAKKLCFEVRFGNRQLA